MKNIEIEESGVIVWRNNTFINGTDGIISASQNGNKIVSLITQIMKKKHFDRLLIGVHKRIRELFI